MPTPDEKNAFLQWRFINGKFTREQEIDRQNLLFTDGNYRVIESDGDLRILELSNFSGSRISYENNPMTIKIEIGRNTEIVQITNVLFVRANC